MPRTPEQIFHDAREIADPAQRLAFLDDACAGDKALRTRVEALLAADAEAGSFLKTVPSPDRDPDATETMSRAHRGPKAPAEQAGQMIGPYKLLQQIGEGGFGTVWMAEQKAPVKRRVALKVIKLGMDTKQVIARFEAERQALALMDHPHIASVFDAGATEAGRPYFVMEYVVGDAITDFADAHKLSVRDRLELFNQACTAVQHAHTKGIIHRDIKPGNILVSMTDGRPFAKVIDFGIAKATASPLTEKTLFTEHHQLIGTLEYMSPEQAEGLPDIDTRTDVYALGVLLYELLTGQTPLDGKRLRSAAWNEMRRIIKEEEPPAPSMRLSRDLDTLAKVAAVRQAEPTKLSAQLKGELDWIAIKALDKDRARRYETPSALAADVQRHLDGEAVVAAPPSRGYKVRKFVQRNKGMVIGGSAVAAALLLGIVGTSIGLGVAQHNANVAYTNAEIAQTARDELSKANTTLVEQADEAEWSAYTANLALAQMAMDNGNWPEARDRVQQLPMSKLGWEGVFLKAKANATLWTLNAMPMGLSMSDDGRTMQLSWGVEEMSDQVRDVMTGRLIAGEKPLASDIVFAAMLVEDAIRTEPSYLFPDDWSKEARQLLDALAPAAWRATYSPDGSLLASADIDNGIGGQMLTRMRPTEAFGGPVQKLWLGPFMDLQVGAILSSVDASPLEGIAIVTPDGTRRIVGGSDRTVRFYDTITDRELASIRVDDAVTDLKMAGDGTRLVIMLADGSARVWDIREPEARRKDYERAWAEREPAGQYLDKLMASPTPTAELMAVIETDPTLTPLRRLAAAEVLTERLTDIESQADRAFAAITKDQADKATVLAAAESADLPVRVKEHMLDKAEAWASAQPRNSEEEEPSEAPKQ